MGSGEKINYQSVIFNQSIDELDRSLVWLSSAVKIASRDRDIEFNVLFGDCSPVQKVGYDIWEDWSQSYSELFNLKYIFFGENLGHGGGQNRLSKEVESDYLVIANPDVLVSPEAIDLMLREFESNSKLALADGRQLPLEHPKEYDRDGNVSWCSGAFMMARTSSFQAVGGFDHQNFYMHGDDVDLSWNIKSKGMSIKHIPEAYVYHPKRLTSDVSISSTETERTYSALSSLLLPYKWSRDDVFEAVRQIMVQSSDPFHKRALEEFELRRDAGNLPEPVDAENSIAIFVDGNYSRHRW